MILTEIRGCLSFLPPAVQNPLEVYNRQFAQ